MAYGMSSEELARVGSNINSSGAGLDESSIKKALDEEIDEERKAAIDRNRARSTAARSVSAQQKADLKNQMIMAVTESAQKGLDAYADAQQSKADREADAGDAVEKPEKLTRSGRVAKRSQGLMEKADIAAERGNVYRQNKLIKRADNLSEKSVDLSKAEQIAAKQRQDMLNQKIEDRKKRTQARLDRSAYSLSGDLYGKGNDIDTSVDPNPQG
jgi:hypothetical protein